MQPVKSRAAIHRGAYTKVVGKARGGVHRNHIVPGAACERIRAHEGRRRGNLFLYEIRNGFHKHAANRHAHPAGYLDLVIPVAAVYVQLRAANIDCYPRAGNTGCFIFSYIHIGAVYLGNSNFIVSLTALDIYFNRLGCGYFAGNGAVDRIAQLFDLIKKFRR